MCRDTFVRLKAFIKKLIFYLTTLTLLQILSFECSQQQQGKNWPLLPGNCNRTRGNNITSRYTRGAQAGCQKEFLH